MNSLINTQLTSTEELALRNAVRSSGGLSEAKTAILKSLIEIGAISETQDVATWEILDALAHGSASRGQKLLFNTMSTLSKYLSDWGVMMILTLGFYQTVQTARATAAGFTTMVDKLLSFAFPGITIGKALATATGRVFKDAAQDGDPATGLTGIANLARIEVPLFGVMLQAYETIAPAQLNPVKGDISYDHNNRTVSRIMPSAGYDTNVPLNYDEGDQEDVSYDELSDEDKALLDEDAENNAYDDNAS